jgi:predicted transcriptional regulator
MAESKKARTFQLSEQVSRRLDELSLVHGLWGSELCDLILRRGLEEMEAGRWQLKKKPIKFKGSW